MKKIYFTKEARLQARRDSRKQERYVTASKEKYIERLPESGCWIWMGTCWEAGYGYLRVDGKLVSAHRYFYKFYMGDFPKELHVLHKCDVRCCVNPEHLFLGTQKDNMQDMVKKGRGADVKGKNNPNYKHGKYIITDSMNWN